MNHPLDRPIWTALTTCQAHLAQRADGILRYDPLYAPHRLMVPRPASRRSLQRECQAVLGKSPLGYFQDLRVERAQSLIRSGELGLDAIADEVGYIDGATLRTLLRQRLGRGVRELRADQR